MSVDLGFELICFIRSVLSVMIVDVCIAWPYIPCLAIFI
jgi:hypothetical protein